MEVVSCFKYLGTIVDSKLSFSDNVVYVYKKARQRVYLLKKLRSFWVGSHVLESVYRCLVEIVFSFNIVNWYGHLSVKNRAQLARVVNTASKIIAAEKAAVWSVLSLCRKSLSILHDKTHPIHFCFQHLMSGWRLKVPLAKKNVYKKYFIPTAVSVFNAGF